MRAFIMGLLFLALAGCQTTGLTKDDIDDVGEVRMTLQRNLDDYSEDNSKLSEPAREAAIIRTQAAIYLCDAIMGRK